MTEHPDVVVVGGGQAGLAMGHHLAHLGMPFVILDAADTVGATWSDRWDSLQLFTPARFCELPGLPFPGDPDRLPSTDEVAGYLRSYRSAFDLPVRHGVRVTSVAPLGPGEPGWRIRTTEDDESLARHVVVATGPFAHPFVPDCARALVPEVAQLHSSAYRNPQQPPNGPVLVVGGGNSGVQIARDLVSAGRETFLALGGRMLARHTDVELLKRVVACRHDALLTADLRVVRPAAVIWATGFSPDFSWVRAPVFDDGGRPIHHRGVISASGLHFLGLTWLHTRGSALLGWVGRDAAYLSKAIAGQDQRAKRARYIHHPRSPTMTTDINTKRGRTVEVEMEARPATWRLDDRRDVEAWTYDGDVPGPVIECEVGDTLVVRLTNALPEPTTIHWHGVRLPASMDGTELVQRAVQPGETFEYRFDLTDAGTFWYHPHTNETVQMERGLYGVLLVRDPADPIFDREQVLVLDDLKLDRAGKPASFGGRRDRHDGRRGPVFLVNGKVGPELTIRGGQIERWRIVNAASSRYVRLSLGGQEFRIIGTDGGLIPAPFPTKEVLLTPGDRVELAVGPFAEGETIALESLPYSRGMMKEKGGRWATLRVGSTAPSIASVPATLRSLEPLVSPDATPGRTVRLGGSFSLRRGVDWKVDDHMHHHAPPVRVGQLQVWEVVNETKMDHPFHLHGFFFQVLEVNGRPPAFTSWEDTVNVPAGGRVKIAWLPDDRPGAWMYHCHILEHAAAGMMAHFEVVGPDGAASDIEQRSCHPAR